MVYDSDWWDRAQVGLKVMPRMVTLVTDEIMSKWSEEMGTDHDVVHSGVCQYC